VTDWTGVFRVVAGFGNLTEEHQEEVLARVARKTSFVPTPMRTKRPAEVIVEDQKFGLLTDSWSDPVENVLLSSMLVGPPMTSDETLSFFKVRWNRVLNRVKDGERGVKEHVLESADFMEEVDNKVVKLAAIVGNSLRDPPTSDIWSSIGVAVAALADHDQRLLANAESVTACSQVTLQLGEKVDSIGGVVSSMKTDLDQFVFPIVANLAKRFKSCPTIPSGHQGTDNVNVPALEQQMRSMWEEFTCLKSTTSAPSYSSGQSGMTVDSMALELGTLKDAMYKLTLENVKLRQDMSMDSIRFGSQVFPTKASYIAFVDTYVPSGYFGCCMDFVSILDGKVEEQHPND
jgi:hypothetical protein